MNSSLRPAEPLVPIPQAKQLAEKKDHHHHKHGEHTDNDEDAKKAEADFEDRLKKFYGKYHPDKLSETHKIAKHYWKHEEACKLCPPQTRVRTQGHSE